MFIFFVWSLEHYFLNNYHCKNIFRLQSLLLLKAVVYFVCDWSFVMMYIYCCFHALKKIDQEKDGEENICCVCWVQLYTLNLTLDLYRQCLVNDWFSVFISFSKRESILRRSMQVYRKKLQEKQKNWRRSGACSWVPSQRFVFWGKKAREV